MQMVSSRKLIISSFSTNWLSGNNRMTSVSLVKYPPIWTECPVLRRLSPIWRRRLRWLRCLVSEPFRRWLSLRSLPPIILTRHTRNWPQHSQPHLHSPTLSFHLQQQFQQQQQQQQHTGVAPLLTEQVIMMELLSVLRCIERSKRADQRVDLDFDIKLKTLETFLLFMSQKLLIFNDMIMWYFHLPKCKGSHLLNQLFPSETSIFAVLVLTYPSMFWSF